MKIGVLFGSPETTTGGNALKFYSSIRLDIRKAASIKNGEDVIGNRVRVKVIKNKVAAPFKHADFDIIFGKGISRTGDVLDLAVEKNIVSKMGAWFSYHDERLGQGRENSKDFLTSNPALLKRIETELLAACLVNPTNAASTAAATNNAGSKPATASAASAVAQPKAPEAHASNSAASSHQEGKSKVTAASKSSRP